MKLYYHAVTQDGKAIRGLIDAKDPQEAARYLRKHQFVPIKIIPATQGFGKFLPFARGTSQTDLLFFTRQLSSMLASGLTLMQALTVMKNQIENSAMGGMVQGIINDIENGQPFSSALQKYPHMFSSIYVALIQTAETSGLLDKILLRLADNLEKQQKLRREIKGALIYPALIVAMMIVVIIIMMVFVVPQLNSLFGNSPIGTSLPLPTRVIIGLSEAFLRYWLFLLVAVVLISFYGRKWYQTESGRRTVHGYVLKLPIFGKLISESILADSMRTLGLLISSGSLVVESLVKTANTVNNVLYRQALLLAARRVEKGITIGDAIGTSILFPAMVVETIKIGEQTGKLDESLLRISEYYEREVDQMVKTLTTLLEPVIMIILAIGVGFLVFAVITPIYSAISSLQ